MSGMEANKNNKLAKISVAARAALRNPVTLDIIKFFSAGPSIRARARLALAAAFLVAAPALFFGVMRTEKVSFHAARLSEYDDYWKRLLEIRIAIKELDLAIWAYSVEREFENSQAVILSAEYLKKAFSQVIRERPAGLDTGPRGFFEGLLDRLDGVIKRSIANRGSMAQARLSIMTISKELSTVENRVVEIARREKREALGALSMVGRDQLILFLILLFAIPIFVGFIPSWLTAPLTRLRQIISKIELGQLKEISVLGHDEVSALARSLKSYFLRKEDLDQKKSSKIFEMRNVLRAVINRVKEPIFIVDSSIKINYTNEAASNIVGLPPHQMEGKLISDCIYSPGIKKALEKSFTGDVNEKEIEVSLETSDGRAFSMLAKIGMVRNRDGEVARSVLVLFAKGSDSSLIES